MGVKNEAHAPTSNCLIVTGPIFSNIDKTYAIVVTQNDTNTSVVVTDLYPAASRIQYHPGVTFGDVFGFISLGCEASFVGIVVILSILLCVNL